MLQIETHDTGLEGGAGEGNRTLVVSLEGFCSTIELHPPISERCASTGRSAAIATANGARQSGNGSRSWFGNGSFFAQTTHSAPPSDLLHSDMCSPKLSTVATGHLLQFARIHAISQFDFSFIQFLLQNRFQDRPQTWHCVQNFAGIGAIGSNQTLTMVASGRKRPWECFMIFFDRFSRNPRTGKSPPRQAGHRGSSHLFRFPMLP